MLKNKLPEGGTNFSMVKFRRSLSSLLRTSSFSSLRDKQDLIIKIFNSFNSAIRRSGKIPSSSRSRAISTFTKEAEANRTELNCFKRILDNYK